MIADMFLGVCHILGEAKAQAGLSRSPRERDQKVEVIRCGGLSVLVNVNIS